METSEKGMGACSLTEEQRKMVEDNHGLIYVALKQYCTPREYEDFYGAMAEGLCKAVQTYDPNRGIKFSTYAMKCMWSIRFMIKRKECTQRRGAGVTTISLSDPIPDTDGCCVEDLLAGGSDFAHDYEQSTLIRKVLDRLAEKYKMQHKCGTVDKIHVIKRVCIDGASQDEVAKELGVCQATISRIVKRTKRDLMHMLKQEGIETW